ncbi:MAG: glycosyltransferase family 39 protein [Flavobacteriales bacterium]|nr:glycosyltransferase family 39 protein [Flavobacteriales bacterium]
MMDRTTTTTSERRTELLIFLLFLAIRGVFLVVTSNMGLELDRDNVRYDKQSTGILNGDFDLETQYFITAPFYPYTQALFKLLFGGYWTLALGAVQLLLCALTGVYLRRIALLLFDRRVALVATVLYAVFPLTLLWVGTRAQDMPFQIALIFALHALMKAVRADDLRRTLLAASLFAITFLIKSHILLFAPFIPLYWWLNMKATPTRRTLHIGVYVATCFVFTLPYGLYNLKKHDMYVISSTGQGGFFLVGHNDDVYRFIVDPPPLGSAEHRRIFNMQYRIMDDLADTLATLPHKQRQEVMLQAGIDWCRKHPSELAELSAYDLFYFLLPGVNPHHYTMMNWLAMLAISLPIYLLAYAGLIMALREGFRVHSWILGLLLSMIAFSVVFYVQNRFRTITLEPFYLIYAAFATVRLARRFGLAKRWPALIEPVKA